MSETYFIKKKKETNYTQIDNTCVKDARLSWKEKGVHTYLMTLPEDWKIYLSELVRHSRDGKSALYSAIQTLEKYGYIKRIRNRDENGRFEQTAYYVYEEPLQADDNTPLSDNPDMENPDVVKPDMENPNKEKRDTENQTLLNTNKLTTNNIQNTELTNLSSSEDDATQTVSESVFVKIIKGLFSGEYPFDKNFESAVLKHLTEAGIEEANVEAYLKYVFERTKLGNVQKSFEGLFRKLALASSIIRDFKNSCFIKKAEKEQPKSQNIKYVDCPICSTRFKEFDFNCPTCGVSVKEIKDQNQIDFIVKKKLYEMSESEKDAYEAAWDKMTKQVKERTGRPFLLENEKIQFWKEYGILN